MMAWTCDVSIEEKVRQDCYNRGYEQGRKNPAEEFWAGVEKLQKQVKEYQDKIEQGTLFTIPFMWENKKRVGEYVVVYEDEEDGHLMGECFTGKDGKEEAEAKLKELQNG